ncbi:D-alanine--D-alanine ligase family protein [Kineococcus rhizosphaerae]|uniref:D-alanine--D-alanine ligase n=1 Tax=Kineococcus rhizosphaerae TaxID=559628 RepID=A0A2T0QYJ2_9ACTN|nr:D-alanine--D-alanine ligase [Kineococcus rhizosphaerae]PRY11443.1 D-alanine-D-alanine ligase [Kineococcus rhizosphaerae]
MSDHPEPTTVTVLAGGLSHERDVSLRSGRRVAEALRTSGFDVDVLDADAHLLPRLAADRPDVVWPVLHGAIGEDGALRDVLEVLGLPYVGSRPAACRLAWDKPIAQSLVAAAGISVPASIALPQATFRDLGAQPVLAAAADWAGFPLVVKPSRGGSALGVAVVGETRDLARAVVDAFAYGDTALVQQFVPGTEVAVSVVETGGTVQVLPAVEIVADGGSYDYAARYTAGATEFFAPARLPDDVAERVAKAARGVHEALGLRHLSRVDFIVTDAGDPVFLEANAAPGMTETSLLPQAAEAAGIALDVLYRGIVESVLG